MRNSRIFQPVQLASGNVIELSDGAARHVVDVLRLRKDDRLRLFNGIEGEFDATIVDVGKRNVKVNIGQFYPGIAESPLQIHLGQAISRGDRMDITVQKAVELGVHEITPLLTEHCVVKLTAERLTKRQQHWQAIAISAAEQSGRCYIPIVHAPLRLEQWLSQLPAAAFRLLLQPAVDQKITKSTIMPQTVALLVGAEGGLSPAEVKSALTQGFQAQSLGPRILRTETAALVAVSILQSQWGDL